MAGAIAASEDELREAHAAREAEARTLAEAKACTRVAVASAPYSAAAAAAPVVFVTEAPAPAENASWAAAPPAAALLLSCAEAGGPRLYDGVAAWAFAGAAERSPAWAFTSLAYVPVDYLACFAAGAAGLGAAFGASMVQFIAATSGK